MIIHDVRNDPQGRYVVETEDGALEHIQSAAGLHGAAIAFIETKLAIQVNGISLGGYSYREPAPHVVYGFAGITFAVWRACDVQAVTERARQAAERAA